MPHLAISILGSFQITSGGVPVTGFKSWHVRALLIYLVVERFRPLLREALAGLLWPECPDTKALSNLRYAISNLRQVIGDRRADPHFLLITRETIQLNPAGDFELDLDGLQKLERGDLLGSDFIDGQHVPPEILFRGNFLEGFSFRSAAFEEWVLYWREKTNRRISDILMQLAVHYQQAAIYAHAIACARRLVELEPWEEKGHQILMRSLALNQQKSAAMAQYELCSRILQQDLRIPPSEETTRLYQDIRAGKLSPKLKKLPGKASAPRFSNIPFPLTSFIGRQTEIEEITRLLSKHRLLTLVGAGGCGKTRLANEIGRRLAAARDYKYGVWWVDLAPLDDPGLIPQAIAAAFGLRESPGSALLADLVEYLDAHEVLIVLDNCEHLLEACARVIETLLSACQHIRIIATSRASINLIGECTFNVPSLSLPPLDSDPFSENYLTFEALQLFTERAAAVLPGFKLIRSNAPAVVQICRRLDGIPLAIELAAVRVKALSVEQIAARLGDRFQLLINNSMVALPRHRTLRAAIDWSYDLLTDPERVLLRRLSVFASSFSLEAFECVCEKDQTPPSLHLLTRLVDKSLVMVQPQEAEARYWLSESIRQYAHEKLRDSGEADLVRARLLEYASHLAEEAETHLGKPDQMLWLIRLEFEINNLRAALAWALTGSAPEQGLRLVGLLAGFWRMRGYLSEGREWLRKALECCPQAPPILRANAMLSAGFLAFQQGVVGEAIRRGEESLALFQASGDQSGMASALLLLGVCAHFKGNYDQEARFLKESLSLSHASQDPADAAYTLLWMGRTRMKSRDFPLAMQLLEESAKLYQQTGDQDGLAFAIGSLGDLERAQGNFAHAAELRKQGLRLARQAGSRLEICYGLEHLALIAAAERENERAARLWGAAEALRTFMHRSFFPSYEAEYNAAVLTVRAGLGEDRFKSAWRQGGAMTVEQAVEFALE